MSLPCYMEFSSPLLTETLLSSKNTLPEDEYLCGIQLELSLARPMGVLEIFEPRELGPSLHVQPAIVAELVTDWNCYQQREIKNDRIPSFTHAAFFLLMAYVNE